jgi:hypothetical protein
MSEEHASIIRLAVQEAVASVSNREAEREEKKTWLTGIMAIIGICSFISTIFFYVTRGEISKSQEPIKTKIALIQDRQDGLKESVDQIRTSIQNVEDIVTDLRISVSKR